MELWVRRWDDDCPWTAAIDAAYQSAREAVRLAPNLSDAHVALGWTLSYMRQHEAAITEFERATQLNPNSTDYHFAFALLVAGEPAKAIQTLEAHMRLDPFYQPRTTAMLGFAYYLLERYVDALPHLQEAASRAPNHGHSRRYLAATYAQLGQLDRAREEAAEALRIEPWFTIDARYLRDDLQAPRGCRTFQRRAAQGRISRVMTRLPGEPIVSAPIMRRTTSAFPPRCRAGMAASGHDLPIWKRPGHGSFTSKTCEPHACTRIRKGLVRDLIVSYLQDTAGASSKPIVPSRPLPCSRRASRSILSSPTSS